MARDHKKVALGYAGLDYFPRDFNAVQQLHGMSAVRKPQILAVMQKVLELYRSKGFNRNLVVNADDFKYIFTNNIDDDNNLDNKVKTVLLMIEKDFSSSRKLGYSPFVARPRSIFGNEHILVTAADEQRLLNSRLKNYFERITNLTGGNYVAILSVNLSGIWEKYYKTMSFPEFKYRINTTEMRDKMQHAKLFQLFHFASGVQYEYGEENNTNLAEYKKILAVYQKFLDNKQRTDTQFEVKELGNFIHSELKIQDVFEARGLAQVLINATFEYQKLKNTKILRERLAGERTLFSVMRSSDIFAEFVIQTAYRLYHPKFNYAQVDGMMNQFYYRSSAE